MKIGTKYKILSIDEEKEVQYYLKRIFLQNVYKLYTAGNGKEGMTQLANSCPDLALLDLILPDIEGIRLIKEIRKVSDCQIIVLSSKAREQDKVKALDAGADDYVTKPFGAEELLARIRALSRRPKDFSDHTCLSYLDIRFDPDTRIMACQDKEQLLSKRKALLMEFFMRNPDKTLTREQIYSRVWGPDGTVEDGNLDTYIYFLRKHLLTLKSRACIQTVHGMGYRLEGNHVS